ncbi:COX15/CtaA family protein [Futiania mangrovi]|uniref:Heme A synthase n=1 Tax=Futiania mangrovi TaxID=2959716 RepID=A0A9J6PE15_9PROT|nr:COX15/CtaA family protein [Futiania mangrovii]MCP1336064.1 COX15/CtaA family protein [Futiania mangrovii]
MSRVVIAGETRAHAAARPVVVWLSVVALLIVVMVVVGGMTRLTDSGLSITDWRPVTGAIPPLSEGDWLSEFEKYRASPQYEHLNRGMGLEEFKGIYWWEWGHRQLGRLIGLTFAVPLFFFMLTGRVRGGLAAWLVFLLALGGLQAFVGWIMVASGLEGARTTVSHYKLASHLGLAILIYGMILWTILRLARGPRPYARRRGFPLAVLFAVLVFAQILSGALVAGLDAGLIYNTWPLIDGAWVPQSVVPGLAGLDDHLTVQFYHRMLAYVIVAAGLLVALRLWRTKEPGLATTGLIIAALVLGQVALGIVTLVTVAPMQHIWLAVAHQLGALILFTASVATLHTTRYL